MEAGILKKKPVSLRLDPTLIEAVRAKGVTLTGAVESGLRMWLKREDAKSPRRSSA